VDSKGNVEPRELLAHPAQRENEVLRDQQDLVDQLVPLAHQDLLAMLDSKVQGEKLVYKEQEASQVQQVLLDHGDQQDQLAHVVNKDSKVKVDLKDPRDSRVLLDRQAVKDQGALLGRAEVLERLEQRDRQAHGEKLDQEERQETLDNQVPLVLLVQEAKRDHLDKLVHQD
jgi:hypothetical protein